MVIIFAFSAQPSDESTQTSLAVGTMICRIIVPGYESLPLEEQRQMADNIEFPVRKTAHATEYAYGNTIIYTVPAKRLNVVVSPEDYLFVKDMEISKYHNTALTDFPKEINNGKKICLHF